MLPSDSPPIQVRRLQGNELLARLPLLEVYARREEKWFQVGASHQNSAPLSQDPRWLLVFKQAFGHRPYALEAVRGNRTCGLLSLCYVRSLLFGRFLVSLPYLNSAGVMADDQETAGLLMNEAVQLANELRVRHLELRHEQPLAHETLNGILDTKVHMRLSLPDFSGPPSAATPARVPERGTSGGARAGRSGARANLWSRFPAKVRNQIRKGEKSGLTFTHGQKELLPEFYAVFSQNMRDLGTPVYSRRLFQSILEVFPNQAELCVVRAGTLPVAGALLLHGEGVTEVPSASTLRTYNHTCANMLLYWNLLQRAQQRGQSLFDFGRSTIDSGPHRFKKQWGAVAHSASWQYYHRGGQAADLRPANPRFRRLIDIWRRLPVGLTRLLGPVIVRGIP